MSDTLSSLIVWPRLSFTTLNDCFVAGETMSHSENKAAKDMTEAMEKTMQRLQGRFRTVSEQLECKNEMGTRIDDLERNITELMTQAGMEEQANVK